MPSTKKKRIVTFRGKRGEGVLGPPRTVGTQLGTASARSRTSRKAVQAMRTRDRGLQGTLSSSRSAGLNQNIGKGNLVRGKAQAMAARSRTARAQGGNSTTRMQTRSVPNRLGSRPADTRSVPRTPDSRVINEPQRDPRDVRKAFTADKAAPSSRGSGFKGGNRAAGGIRAGGSISSGGTRQLFTPLGGYRRLR